jgi:hypothetical protein
VLPCHGMKTSRSSAETSPTQISLAAATSAITRSLTGRWRAPCVLLALALRAVLCLQQQQQGGIDGNTRGGSHAVGLCCRAGRSHIQRANDMIVWSRVGDGIQSVNGQSYMRRRARRDARGREAQREPHPRPPQHAPQVLALLAPNCSATHARTSCAGRVGSALGSGAIQQPNQLATSN